MSHRILILAALLSCSHGARPIAPTAPPAAPPAGPAARGEGWIRTPRSQPPKPVASGPEARCVGRNPVLYFVCMERECLRSRFTGHADCLAWHKEARRE